MPHEEPSRSRTTPHCDGSRPGPETPPAALIHACIEHREGSWEEFLRRYADLIYSTILKVRLCRADQEDAFQVTVAAIHKDLCRLRKPESIAPWVIGIAYRQALNCVRARVRSREEATDAVPASVPFEGTPPDEERIELERVQQVREAMEAIPERCRTLLRLLYFEEPQPGYIEIGRAVGLPIGSIGPTRARCFEKLRRVYEQRGWTP